MNELESSINTFVFCKIIKICIIHYLKPVILFDTFSTLRETSHAAAPKLRLLAYLWGFEGLAENFNEIR